MQRTGPPSISLPGKYCTLYPDLYQTDIYIKLIKCESCYGRKLGRALTEVYWKSKNVVGLFGFYVRDCFSFCSETFSFVLTGEDGSRRFGYCRRLLVIIPRFFFLFLDMQPSVGLVLLAPILESGKLLLFQCRKKERQQNSFALFCFARCQSPSPSTVLHPTRSSFTFYLHQCLMF